MKTLIKKSEHKVIGTKVHFTFEKSLDVEFINALRTALEGRTKPGIDNQLNFL
jgi:hypothetical protein